LGLSTDFFTASRQGCPPGDSVTCPRWHRLLQEAEKVNLKWAEREAASLREELPLMKQAYSRTALATAFPWERMSLIVGGAFLGDFCVFDRIPFRQENRYQAARQRLPKGDGEFWDYTGFEKLPHRFETRRWKFYQNVNALHNMGTSR
jgi:hypothetical protein